MLKIYLFIICSGILYNFAVGNETKEKEKVYYKHTESTAAVKPEHELTNMKAIVMEGQSAPVEYIKHNSTRINSSKEIVKKGGKTVPRKGVNLNNSKDEPENSDISISNSTLNISTVKQTNESHSVLSSIKPIINSTKFFMNTEKSSTARIVPVKEVLDEEEIINNVIKQKTVKKPKPKPEVTVGEKDADEPIPASPTLKSPLGMPRKIDYIVPVVITVTALPLLGVAFYVLYKRGRDYWDKRHYRRMDFLIDGMYNE